MISWISQYDCLYWEFNGRVIYCDRVDNRFYFARNMAECRSVMDEKQAWDYLLYGVIP